MGEQLEETLLPEPQATDNRLKAIIAINLFALAECLFGVTWKMTAAHGVSVANCGLVRSSIQFILNNALCLAFRKHPCRDAPKGLINTLILRGTMGVICFGGVTWALTMCPLSLYTIVFNLAPFWCSLLGFAIHSEAVHSFEIAALVICFAGVIGVALGPSDSNDDGVEDQNHLLFGIFVAFATSFLYAVLCIVVRRLKVVHFSVLAWWHSLVGSVLWFAVAGGYAMAVGEEFLVYDAETWMWLVITAVTDWLTVLTNAVAFQSDSSGFVSLLGYTQVVYAFLADVFIFRSSIAGMQFFCALGICAVTVGVSVYKLKVMPD